MKPAFFLIVAVCLAATGTLFAQADIIIKQRAKQLRDQNNTRQGVPAQPPAPPAAAPAAPAARPATGGLSPAAQQNIATLQADLSALSAKSGQPKPPLAKDLMAAALGAAKPTQDSVTKLATNLQGALAGNELSSESQGRLARALNAAVNGVNLSPDQIQTLVTDVQAILQASGAKRGDAVAVADDFKAVVAEVKKSAGK